MIIDTITDTSRLYHDLKAMGRDNFSHNGAKALFEYLDNLSDEIGEPLEYDPITWCCNFAEYANLAELQADGYDVEDMDEVGDQTKVIYVDDFGTVDAGLGRFIVGSF